LTRWGLGAIILVLAGCATWPLGRSPAVLDRADHLVAKGDYAAAAQMYDEFLAKHADDREAARARTSRDAVAGILSARSEISRLRAELDTRDGEVGRLRQEIARLTAEADRLRGEADRIRADVEKLKRLDLEQERRRR
jgi:chromosome segregation ATPase